MTTDSYYYQPAQGHGLPHDPFGAIIGPRPIGWISSQDSTGRLNLAPYSFFNAFNYQPPIIGFASVGRKDSLNNIEQTGEFAWNLVTRSLAEAMNQSSCAVAANVDEFVLSQLTPTPSRLIATPRVLESPVSFECKLTQIVQLQSHAQLLIPTWLILGEVVAVHIAKHMLNNGIYDTAAGEPILRGGAADYFQISPQGRFSMQRP
jgi:flavin reductase (DIM6/NTAB) family NADH-FMN oxidoreductase RutF